MRDVARFRSALRIFRKIAHHAFRHGLAGVLTFAMALGAFTPAATAAGLEVVAQSCAAELPAPTCEDDLGRILQLLLAVQSQLIQEEDEHPPPRPELVTTLAATLTLALPEPLLLQGEDMSPALLRPPRAAQV